MVRKAFAISSFLVLLMLGAITINNYNREWKGYQRQYFYELAREKEGSLSWVDRLVTETKLGTVKVVTDPGRSADMCMTCHINWGGAPTLEGQPLADLNAIHPEFILKNYPFDQYGCTACHGGQPLALTREGAHEGLRDAMATVFEQKVRELTAPDWLTRQRAIETIRWMTGNDFGYRQNAPLEEKQAAIERILVWWTQHQDTFLVEGFGERESPFKTENPLGEEVANNPSLGPDGSPLAYVNDNSCVACHLTRTRERLQEAIDSGSEDGIQAAQAQLDHIRLFAKLDLSDIILADEAFDSIAKNYTCQMCHGPGEQYIKLMQKGYALLLQGKGIESSEILKKATTIARQNARLNLSDPRVWELMQQLVAKTQAPPPPPAPSAPPPETPAPPEAGPAIEQGRLLAQTRGCLACHSVDGSPGVGPTWKGLYGKQEALADGTTVPVDEAYLRESILDPSAKLVEGFPPAMPPYTFSDEELRMLIAYLESLAEE